VFRRSLRIRTDAGYDRVTVADSTLHGKFPIRTGDGNDEVFLTGIDAENFARTAIFTGYDRDIVDMLHCDFSRSVRVNTSYGQDDVRVDRCNFNGDVDFDTGHDDDILEIFDSSFDDDVDFDGGSGHDHMRLEDNDFEAFEKHRFDFDHRATFRARHWWNY
jgi:hypothetical protein